MTESERRMADERAVFVVFTIRERGGRRYIRPINAHSGFDRQIQINKISAAEYKPYRATKD